MVDSLKDFSVFFLERFRVSQENEIVPFNIVQALVAPVFRKELFFTLVWGFPLFNSKKLSLRVNPLLVFYLFFFLDSFNVREALNDTVLFHHCWAISIEPMRLIHEFFWEKLRQALAFIWPEVLVEPLEVCHQVMEFSGVDEFFSISFEA